MDSNVSAYKALRCMKILVPIIAFGLVLTIVTFAITAVTLAKVNREFDKIQISDTRATSTSTANPTTTTATNSTPTASSTTTTNSAITTEPLANETLAANISMADVMNYLNALQRIATDGNGNRAIDTIGFNDTLDFIIDTLRNYTDYNIMTSFFPVRQFILLRDPILLSSVNGTVRNHTYSSYATESEFYQMQFSPPIAFADYVELSAIPNWGCDDDDWITANPPPVDRVALVKRGNCTLVKKATLASKYNVTVLLIYNDGDTPDRIPAGLFNLGESNYVPALFLSYTLGQALADAAQDSATNVSVLINLSVNDAVAQVGNICADTPTGDPTQTIVIGSHSDSVPAGPGINDNGSGSAANLGLAITLARLFQTSTYNKYKYRVRFCWWGAEELGLLGAAYHVAQARNSIVVGDRLSDYLINLNYDMLGSPNFMFGIYDGQTAPDLTPVSALAGSNKITALFQSWFQQQNLPWNNTGFDGRSDYGPFLAEGIVAGGLFSGDDGTKSQAERDYYNQMLGQGMGGIAGIIHDPCYHEACDSIENINTFCYEKLVQAAAYVLEFLARQDDLRTWLYPNGTASQASLRSEHRKYNSINEYFRMPYF